jgi:non-heme chloroperoxidase
MILIVQLSFSQDLAGNWQGMVKMGPQDSRVVLKIAKGYGGGWNAKFYSIDQGLLAITMDSVVLQDSNLNLVWNDGQGHCEGTIGAEIASIKGVCTWGQFSFPVTLQRATKETAWKIDESTHSVRFITADRNVKLEVLDWGGSGQILILLAGLNADAHMWDKFAPKLVAAGYHVYGISRRGFGESSVPLSGYSADRLGDDVLAVIKSLKLRRPVLVGHSIAGEELSSIGSRFPQKVAGLIYLDAAYIYAYYDSSFSDHFSSTQKYNLEKLKAAKVQSPMLQILAGSQKYTDIRAPFLAIYAKKSVDGNERILEAIKRNMPSAKLVILTNAEHNIYLSNEAEVLNEMKVFINNLR